MKCTLVYILASKLHFQPCIQKIEAKVAKAVCILSKLLKSTLILLYYALVHPFLLFALRYVEALLLVVSKIKLYKMFVTVNVKTQ